MKRHRGEVALAALLSLALTRESATAAAPRIYRFAGSVRAGERFERRFADSLRFVLRPSDENGWSIVVAQEDSLADYAAIVTPPFHGPNPVQIEAWHFRNDGNTGPSQGPWPGEERGFSFVTNRRDYDAAASALDVMLWPNGRPDAVVDSARAAFDALSTGSGRLNISALKLRELGAGRQPRFESIQFEVRLRMPPPR